MKKIIPTCIGFLLTLCMLAATAQKTGTTKSSSPTTSTIATTPAGSKLDKTQADADQYIKAAQAAKEKIRIFFPAKGDTVYAVIPGITYADPNLKLLKEAINKVKKTSNLTCSYRNGNAVVKILYKGDASTLYDQLSDELKALFLPDDMEGTRMILTYTQAKPATGAANQ